MNIRNLQVQILLGIVILAYLFEKFVYSRLNLF